MRIIFLILLFLVSCGESQVNPNILSGPSALIWEEIENYNYALSARLNAYNDSGELVASKSVGFSEAGFDFPNFDLVAGKDYRFILVYYAEYEEQAVPFAFVEETQRVGGVSFDLNLASANIHYTHLESDPDDPLLPNLDLDNDGWSNFQELRDLSSPLDANQGVTSPVLSMSSEIIGGDQLSVIITARDRAKIENLALLNYRCALVSEELEDEIEDEETGAKSRNLNLVFDINRLSGDPDNPEQHLELRFNVSDGLISSDEFLNVDYTNSNRRSEHGIAILSPNPGSNLSEEREFELEICGQLSGRESIYYNGIAVNTELPNDERNMHRVIVTVDTKLLEDGSQNITLELIDPINFNRKLASHTKNYEIENYSAIKKVFPRNLVLFGSTRNLKFRTDLENIDRFRFVLLNADRETINFSCIVKLIFLILKPTVHYNFESI